MNLLAGGFSKIELMGALGFPESLKIIGDALIGVFGVNMIFTDWLFVFFIAFLQGLLIGLIALIWNKKQNKEGNSANVEKAGIITGLIALGAGCPTCGTTLITPILISIFSTSGYALAGAISGIITFFAVILLLWSLKRVGLEAYAIIIDEKWRKKVEKK